MNPISKKQGDFPFTPTIYHLERQVSVQQKINFSDLNV